MSTDGTGASVLASSGEHPYWWTPRPFTAGVDIEPRSPTNLIGGRRGIQVAILSSATFDAVNDTDLLSLRFGKTGAEDSLQRCSKGRGRDFDGDGRQDLLCSFKFKKTGLTTASTKAKLSGQTDKGVTFAGKDDVVIRQR